MKTINAIKCKDCGALKEPRNLVLVGEMRVAIGAPNEGNNVGNPEQKVNLHDEAFCDVACLVHFLKTNVEDEIPF